jgi:hypothetical protein
VEVTLSIPPAAWVEAESFVALIYHGRLTPAQARREIGVDDARRAVLSAWIKAMPADCRRAEPGIGGIVHPFSDTDLRFRDAVGAALDILLADAGYEPPPVASEPVATENW